MACTIMKQRMSRKWGLAMKPQVPPTRPISLNEDPLWPLKNPTTFSHHYLRTFVQTCDQMKTLHIETQTNKIALEHSTFVERHKLGLNDRGMVLRGLLAKHEKNLT